MSDLRSDFEITEMSGLIQRIKFGMKGHDMALSYRQKRTIPALLASRNFQQAAQVARVGTRTLFRWLKNDPDFRTALLEAENRTIDEATRRLLAGQEQALDTLVNVMTKADKQSDKRLAAVAWLDIALRWCELRNFEQRLSMLEERLHENEKP